MEPRAAQSHLSADEHRRWRGSSALSWLLADADVGEGNRAGVDL
jgi:hypothetical protein